MTTSRPALPSLTSMRAIAAVGVFFAHVAFFYEATGLRGLLSRVAVGGQAGVCFFFLLSGAILAYTYTDGTKGQGFYVKRFARIYPVYALALVAGIITFSASRGGLGWLHPGILASNVLMLQGWTYHGLSQVPVTSWTLSCELLFYLSFPALLFVARRVPARLVLPLALALGAWATFAPGWFTGHVTGNPYYFAPVIRLPEFALGVFIGLSLPMLANRLQRHAGKLFALAGIAALVVTLYINDVPDFMRETGFYVPIFALAIIAGASLDMNGRHHPLSAKWAVTLGLASYAFYSVHVSAIYVAEHVLHKGPRSSIEAAVVLLILLPVIWFGSWLVYRCFEEPTRRELSRRLRRRTPPVQHRAEPERTDRTPAVELVG